MTIPRPGIIFRVLLTLALACALLITGVLSAAAQSPGPLHHITVAPSNPTVTSGGSSQTFTATGYDASNNPISGLTFAWSVTNAQAGSIDSSTGVFTAGAIGGAFVDVVQATSGGITGKASVTVAGPMHHITVTPNDVTVEQGATQQFTAQGYDQYNIPRTGDAFVWSVSDPLAGSIDASTGVFTAGTSIGSYSGVVRATSGDKWGSATVTIPVPQAPLMLFNQWGASGTGDSQFALPGATDIALDASGNVYVVDSGNHRIQQFNSRGQFLLKWGSLGGADGQFGDTGDIAVDASGNVYVVDSGNNRVQKFDSNGNFLLKWGSLGNADGQFSKPHGIGIDGSGNVYVSDMWNNRIQKFTSTGTFLLKWGSLGSLDGQFGISGGPAALGVDAAGNVYVADTDDHRVLKFSSTGAFLLGWPCGDPASGFFDPSDIAVDPSGDVFVGSVNSGMYDDSVRKYSSSGALRYKLGGGIHNYTVYPAGIAVDSSGNLFVANRSMVKEFTSPAPPIADFYGTGQVSGNQTIVAPQTVEFKDTSLGMPTSWVWDFGDGQTSVLQNPPHAYGTVGSYTVSLTATNAYGSNTMTKVGYITVIPGQLHHITVSPANPSVEAGGSQPFTAQGFDSYDNPISGLTFVWSVFNPAAGTIDPITGVFTAGGTGGVFEFAIRATSGGVTGVASVTVAGPLHHIGIDNAQVTVEQGASYTFAARGYDQYNTPRTGDVIVWSVLDAAAGSINATTGVFTASMNPGVYSSVVKASCGTFERWATVTIPYDPLPVPIRQWGTSGAGDGQFSMPMDIAIDPSGNVYVLDLALSRVQKFTSTGQFLLKWGSQGSGDGQFGAGGGGDIAVDASGNVYEADTFNNRIQKFDSQGNFLLKWGTLGGGDGQFVSPRGIGVDASGNVYVLDWGNYRVQVFTSTGVFLRKWGSQGSGDGQFTTMSTLGVDPSGNVYVGDSSLYRIQKFDSSGTLLLKWNTWSEIPGSEYPPVYPVVDIATDASGNVYLVSDTTDNWAVRKFSSSGVLHYDLGGGHENYTLGAPPQGVGVDALGNVYVSNFSAPFIRQFGPPVPSLHHITITPANPLLGEHANYTFTARGYDSSGNFMPGLGFSWSVANPAAGSINSFTGAFTSGPPGVYADAIQAASGAVTGMASVTVVAGAPLKGDTNADGAVGVADLVGVAAAFGSSPPSNPNADVNGDGRVDIMDLVAVGLNFGKSLST